MTRPRLVLTPGGDLAEVTMAEDVPTRETLQLASLIERRKGPGSDIVILSTDSQIAYIGKAIAKVDYPA